MFFCKWLLGIQGKSETEIQDIVSVSVNLQALRMMLGMSFLNMLLVKNDYLSSAFSKAYSLRIFIFQYVLVYTRFN